MQGSNDFFSVQKFYIYKVNWYVNVKYKLPKSLALNVTNMDEFERHWY